MEKASAPKEKTSAEREKGGSVEQKAAAAGVPNTEPDKTAQSTRLGFAVLLVTIYGFLVTIFTFIAWAILYLLPMLLLIGGLVGSAIWREQWLNARSHFSDPYSEPVQKFIKNINIWEDSSNMAVFSVAVLINIWNYFLLILWYVAQLLYMLFTMLIKYVLQPLFQEFVTPFFVMGAQLVSSVADEILHAATLSASTETYTQTGTGGGVIANYTMIGNFTTTEIATRGFQTIMSFEPFFVALNASQFGEIVNWLSDPVLKNAPEIFKFLADTAALTSVGGAWTRVIAEDALSKQANAILTSSNCFSARAVRAGLCATQTWLAESLNKVAHVDGMSIASPSCSIPEIACNIPTGLYSEQGETPWDTDVFLESFFGTGACSALECEYFVEDAYTTFAALPNATCAFWVDDPASVYNCMVLVQNYVEVNSTSRAQASPATLAAEMCIVARAQNLASCKTTGLPWQWDPGAQATTICNSPALNTSFAECSCRYRAPLCTGQCCETYALHVHEQVQLQLGALTCAELATDFPTVGTFCPLIGPTTINRTATTARFPDNTYQSVFCAYAQQVIDPLCRTAPSFTHLRDLDTLSAVPAFAVSTCNATITQLGVCLPVNATVDDLAFDIISYPIAQGADAVYNANDATTYSLGTYLITDFSVGDDAGTIVKKGLQKHFCEQVSQIYKNANLLYESQPGMPLAVAADYCDEAVLTAAGDISISYEAFYKYQSGSGEPIPVEIAGLPDTASAFSQDVNPNLQIGGVCTGQVGPNVGELTSQDKCLESIRTLVYNLAGQSTVDATAVLDVFVMQENYTSEFYTASGLLPIPPDDPNYAQKEVELVRTENVLAAGLSYSVKPWEDLIAATDPFRTTFDTAPPDSSPYSNMPGFVVYTDHSGLGGGPPTGSSSSATYTSEAAASASTQVLSGPGRVLLSEPSSSPRPINWWPRVREFMGMSATPPVPDKWDRAAEALFKKRLVRFGERLHKEVYLKGISEAGPRYMQETATGGGGGGTGRRLMSTGSASLDTKLAAINRDMSNIPHRPLHLTDSQYGTFLLGDTLRLGAEAFTLTTTVLLPKFLENLVDLYLFTRDYNITAAIQRNSFGHRAGRHARGETAPTTSNTGTVQGEVTSQLATVDKPFEGCGEFSDSYECCDGLVGCINFNSIPLLQEKTNVYNVERWNCDDVDYFWGWQRWFWQCLVSVVASFASSHFTSSNSYDTFPGTLVTPYNELPSNLVNCMFVNVYFGFLGAIIITGIYFIFSIGIIGLFAIVFSNARQQQEDQEASTKISAALAVELDRRTAPDAAHRELVEATSFHA